MLYIVATPIGNLEDITLRALETLKGVDVILAEDTRVTRKLLNRYEIKRKVISYHHHSSVSRRLEILNMLNNGKDLALVTDAGTPGISDPGNELISFLIESNPAIKISPIPGPSSLTAAISVSGFNMSKYIFLGFLVKKRRKVLLNELSEKTTPFVFYDSPNRVTKSLKEVREVLGDRKVFVAREMTKVHEEFYRGKISEVIDQLEKEPKLKGEVVVILEALS